AYHPDIRETPEPAPYPRYTEETVSHGGLLFLVSFLFLIPLAICLIVDLLLNGGVSWSGYVAFGLLTAYIVVCLPLWCRSPDPVIFFPIDMAAALGLALYVCLKTGGRWFLPFAFPVGGALLLLVEAEIVLLRHVVRDQRHRALYILGAGLMVLGGLCVLIEFLLHVSFALPMLWWSLIPLAALFLLGSMLLIVGLCRPLRRSLHKRFFI
ncbi:MAG: hypothetical protein IK095_03245, partial [Oscillospiraceae bacterium]|nr:hypothetical protein [Oscillospiraceae bacterium]